MGRPTLLPAKNDFYKFISLHTPFSTISILAVFVVVVIVATVKSCQVHVYVYIYKYIIYNIIYIIYLVTQVPILVVFSRPLCVPGQGFKLAPSILKIKAISLVMSWFLTHLHNIIIWYNHTLNHHKPTSQPTYRLIDQLCSYESHHVANPTKESHKSHTHNYK